MMNIFRKEGDRQVVTGEYDGEKFERLRRDGEVLQRQMRRRVAEHNLQTAHVLAPATELYWAVVVASLVDAEAVSANVMRRDAPDKRTLKLIQKGKQSECDPFWLAKLRAGVPCGSVVRLRPHHTSRWRRLQSTCTPVFGWQWPWTCCGISGPVVRTASHQRTQ